MYNKTNFSIDDTGHFGPYGGVFAPETLIPALNYLTEMYNKLKDDKSFQKELHYHLKDFVGRPTPLYYAEQLTNYTNGPKIYLKREDLCHTGAHKINNALGQVLLAKKMGKTRIIAETGAGQHGVATATAAARFGLECVIYMGEIDMKRQAPNVFRMRMLGAEVKAVQIGQKTLKEAVNESIRDWIGNSKHSHYVLGSVLGPHPFPTIVRDFQSVIGREVKEQIKDKENRLPDYLVACVGGGSNSIGLFHPFISSEQIKMIGVEAGGHGENLGEHASRFSGGKLGILQGTKTYILQDDYGQIANTHSISAGLDYPAIGPEHAYLKSIGRVFYTKEKDESALEAFKILNKYEGILPALESSHALAWVINQLSNTDKNKIAIINLSGRGDKDVQHVLQQKNSSQSKCKKHKVHLE